jgi:adenylate cyclase class 2
VEIEVKIRVKSIEEFERKISFATFHGEEEHTDTYFEMPKGILLRVREIEQGPAILGYKEILDEKNTIFKEIEVEIDDGLKMKEILKRLGFRESAVIKKRRKIYRYKNIAMELNEVENIGTFVDFEIISEDEKSREKIFELIRSLGYSEEDVEDRLYVELALR